MAKLPDQTRNLNPTPEAALAMTFWGKEYSEQRGGSMDFWDALPESRKKTCAARHGRLSALEPKE